MTKHAMVRNKLASMIKDNAYPVGAAFFTEKQVCERFNVSGATARRALDDLRRLGVLERKRGAGTFVAAGSQAGRIVLHKTIGVLLYDASNAFVPGMAAILQGVGEVLQEHRYHMQVLVSTDGQIEKLVSSARVDGLIVGYQQISESALEGLAKEYPPLVALNRGILMDNVCSVATDRILSMLLLGEHLAELGHKRVAFLHGDPSWEITREYIRGYELAVSRLGFDTDDALLIETPGPRNADSRKAFDLAPEIKGFLQNVLAPAQRPTAVIAPTYHAASYLVEAANEMGLDVPSDLSVASLGQPEAEPDPDLSKDKSITHLRINPIEFGRQSAELLFKLMSGDTTSRKNVFLKSELVIGQSTGKADLS